jgi:hypothetical protein
MRLTCLVSSSKPNCRKRTIKRLKHGLQPWCHSLTLVDCRAVPHIFLWRYSMITLDSYSYSINHYYTSSPSAIWHIGWVLFWKRWRYNLAYPFIEWMCQPGLKIFIIMPSVYVRQLLPNQFDHSCWTRSNFQIFFWPFCHRIRDIKIDLN